jgi:hypothetical protein
VLALLCALVVAAPAAHAQEQDPLLHEFAHCEDWYQQRTQPGTEVVACDQAQLDHFMASGLTDPGPGGVAVSGPDRPAHDGVPAVYSSEEPYAFRRVRITGSGTSAGVFVSTLGVDGTRRSATFAPVALPKGEPLHVTRTAAGAQLRTRSGAVLASASLEVEHGSAFHMLRRPRGVHVRRVGDRVRVSWIARARTGYRITSGSTRGSAGRQELAYSDDGRSGRRAVTVDLPAGHRWVGVRAVHLYTFSRMVAVHYSPKRQGRA